MKVRKPVQGQKIHGMQSTPLGKVARMTIAYPLFSDSMRFELAKSCLSIDTFPYFCKHTRLKPASIFETHA